MPRDVERDQQHRLELLKTLDETDGAIDFWDDRHTKGISRNELTRHLRFLQDEGLATIKGERYGRITHKGRNAIEVAELCPDQSRSLSPTVINVLNISEANHSKIDQGNIFMGSSDTEEDH